jgi:hypothetical protein
MKKRSLRWESPLDRECPGDQGRWSRFALDLKLRSETYDHLSPQRDAGSSVLETLPVVVFTASGH